MVSLLKRPFVSARVQDVGKRALPLLGGLMLLLVLYLASLQSYLLFHSLAEIFSIIVAGGIFMVAWNCRQFLEQSYFALLGVAFLFIGLVDLFHTLAYRGMGVFADSGANLAIQLWLGARTVQALSFAVAPALLYRRLGGLPLFGIYTGAVGLLLASIFEWHFFPTCFVDGSGLTKFKIGSEYVICLVCLYALGAHWQARKAFDPTVLRLIGASLLLTVASELAFTLYLNVYGAANLIGHFLKVLAFYLIYKAFVQVALTKPYQLLFLDLTRSREAMRQSQARLEVINRDLQSSLQLLGEDETAARRIQFLLLPPPRMICRGCEFQSAIYTSAFLSGDFVDYFPITQDLTGFYIADVSGHGVSSAFITVLLKSTMGHLLEEHKQGQGDRILHPERVLAALNEYLLQQHFGKYLTMFYGILHTGQGRLAYSNAGQFPCPILADDHGTRFLDQKAMPVGLFSQAIYQTTEISIGPQFHLALFSDGVLDFLPQSDIRGKQSFLLSQVSTHTESVVQLEASLGLTEIGVPADDLTVMLLKAAA